MIDLFARPCLLGGIAFALIIDSAAGQSPPNVPVPVVVSPAGGPANKADWDRRTRAMNACRRAFLGQTYSPQPAIWKVADADTTIYLFGTVHQLPAGFEWRSAQLDEIIRDAGSLLTEDGMRTKRGPNELQKILSDMPGAKPDMLPIVDRLKGERRAKWLGMASMLPENSVQRIDRMPSWLAAIAIAYAGDQAKNSVGVSRGVDAQLEAEFTKAKKPVGAMEDSAAVLAALNLIPEQAQLKLLDSVLDKVGKHRSREEFLSRLHRWARGEAPLGDDELSQFPSEFRKELLDARNAAWVNVVKQKLGPPGISLIAVGAAHLHGTGSLLDLLDKEGFRSEPISPITPPQPRPAFRPMPKSLGECSTYLFGKAKPEAGGN